MSPSIEVFAQFGIGGLAVGLAYALARYLIRRAEEDRQELIEWRTWARDKGWGLMGEMERTMRDSVNLGERMLNQLEANAGYPSAPRRRPPGVRE